MAISESIDRSKILTAVFSTLLIAGHLSAQTTERETLTKPVYRVNNDTPTETADTAHPVSEEPAATVASASSVPLSAALPSEPKIAPEPVAVEPASPVEPSPSQLLGQAVNDAKAVLEYLTTNVTDYTCDFIKRERVRGKLLPVEQMTLKVRNEVVQNGQVARPLSVYMKFHGPNTYKNREILFIQGQNNDKLLIKEGGAKGRFLPAVWLSQQNGLITCCNRHSISDVGLNNLIKRLIAAAAENTNADEECQIRYLHGAKVDGRSCSYLEVMRPVRKPGPLHENNVYLTQVFVDTDMKIPVRYAAYDWPRRPGGRPQLLEEYTYRNVKLNPGLGDIDFSRENPEYKF